MTEWAIYCDITKRYEPIIETDGDGPICAACVAAISAYGQHP